MKTKTKALALFLSAVLLVVTTVFTTMAYLTSRDSVKNTFTFGQVGITLDETDVDGSGTNVTTAGRDKANAYHLIPGKTYVKDPVVHIDANSENCWIFVELNNGLKEIIDATTIEDQMVKNGWSLVSETTNIYAYKEIVGKNMHIPTFTEFNLKDNANVSDYATEDNAANVIEVIAYAVQSETFGSAEAAWNATFGAPTSSAN